MSPKSSSGRRAAPRPPVRWSLTDAESRVIQQLATGLRTSEIALRLGVSVHTIRTHVKRAMAKAGAHSQAALVAFLYLSDAHSERA
ncbi:MAG TPA: helix-turn-helix transcriptional regulator [Steroidobacteraceae bacterium]